ELIDAPGVGRARRAGERTAERDHAAHALRHHLGKLARIEAAEAPADDADLAAVQVIHRFQNIDHGLAHAGTQAQIAALIPAAHRVALGAEESAKRPR